MDNSFYEIQADFCKAMGNSTRLQLVHVLWEGPRSVNEICEQVNLPQGTVSRHLASLRAMGVVTAQRAGMEMVYQISDAKIVEVCDLVRSVLTEQIQNRSRVFSS
jgi:DNA-binding transcriptional ArsR family regulator